MKGFVLIHELAWLLRAVGPADRSHQHLSMIACCPIFGRQALVATDASRMHVVFLGMSPEPEGKPIYFDALGLVREASGERLELPLGESLLMEEDHLTPHRRCWRDHMPHGPAPAYERVIPAPVITGPRELCLNGAFFADALALCGEEPKYNDFEDEGGIKWPRLPGVLISQAEPDRAIRIDPREGSRWLAVIMPMLRPGGSA